MTGIVLAGNGIPGVQVPSWPGLEMTWTGADGSLWDLSSGSGPVTLLGVRGLHLPVVDRYTSQAPGLAGARFRGVRVQPREVWWAIDLSAPPGLAWLEQDAAWWQACSLDDEGEWAVTASTMTRRLRLRLKGSDDDLPRDPSIVGDATYALLWEAGQPFWEGDPVTRLFAAAVGSDHFLSAVGDPTGVLIISPGNTLDAAEITNPGDVPAWPIWTLTGPFTSATVGVAGQTISIPFALTAGHSLMIDTRPDRQTAVDDLGADRVPDLGAVAFGQVPSGQSVPLSITAAGTAEGMTATVQITPLYRRAW